MNNAIFMRREQSGARRGAQALRQITVGTPPGLFANSALEVRDSGTPKLWDARQVLPCAAACAACFMKCFRLALGFFFTCALSLAAEETSSPPAVKLTATVDVAHAGKLIPRGFAGFSREWRRFPFPESGAMGGVHPAYLRLLGQLCAFGEGALNIRVGGASADQTRTVPDADRWRQIAEIYKTTRSPLIININLATGGPELAKDWVRAAKDGLPAEAIASFELGNEPDGWPKRHKPEGYTFENYQDDFHAVATELVPSLTSGLAGPAWAHGAPPETLTAFITKQKGLVNLLTVHAYRFNPKSNPTVAKLLEEGATAGMALYLAPGIKCAHDAGLALRLGETGSAWGGGVPGFSDSFAAALFTLDFFFELANAGLDGVNLHNAGMNAYSPIQEDVDKKTGKTLGITANAPFYGMLLFAEAAGNEAHLVPVTLAGDVKPRVKLWATVDKSGTLRVVAINKSPDTAADIAFTGEARVKRLQAPTLAATTGITLGGQTYDGSKDGNPLGEQKAESLAANHGILHLAPASAALLTFGR